MKKANIFMFMYFMFTSLLFWGAISFMIAVILAVIYGGVR
jgi:hypothetical protein